jgi:2-keto-4-pentenoate hydratase
MQIEWRGPGEEALGRSYALTRREHRRLADILIQAERERRPIAPLTIQFPELNEDDAAQIRDLVIARRLRSGDRVIAAKASSDPSDLSGGRAGSPLLGWITAAMHAPGPMVDVTNLIHPHWHVAFALRLAYPLRRTDSLEDLLTLVDQVLPCLEVVDARHHPGGHSAVDDTADNGSAALIVTAPGRTRATVDVDRLSVAWRSDKGQQWCHSSRPAIARALQSTLPLAHRVLDERRDLGIGGLLISEPASPTLPLAADRPVAARLGPLGQLNLQPWRSGDA